jgi:tRNA (pseudouridine54-N1)-methyltransferase
MKEFVLLALKATTSSDFDVNELVSAGRIDLVCRCISNSLFISNHMREDSIIHVCLNGAPTEFSPKIISFYGATLCGMEWDEKSIAVVIKQALEAGKTLKLGEEIEVRAGLKVSKKAFETLVREKCDEEKELFYLDEKGEDIREIKFTKEKDYVFIFGDFIGMPKNTEKLLKRIGAEKMAISPVMLMASYCPIIVHNELDRRAYKCL